MKSILHYLVPATGLALALPGLRAEDQAPAEQKELRVIAGPDDNAPPPRRERPVVLPDGPRETERVTFLGIATAPAGSDLTDQLNLPKDAGLIVNMILPESPAASALKRHDVLVKLDDQLLIDQRQLSVLVRNHQEGDEVTLTYIRGGKEGTAKVKLTKHEVPKMAMMGSAPFFHARHLPLNDEDDSLPAVGRDDMDRVLALIERGPPAPGQHRQPDRNEGPGMQSTTVSTSNSNMVFSDDKGSLDLTIKDGQKTLIAKNTKGEQLFSGPVTTPEQRKALPPEIRARLDKLEGMQEFSFQTDDDFQGGNTQVVQPGKTKISLPPQAPAAPVPRTPAF